MQYEMTAEQPQVNFLAEKLPVKVATHALQI